MSRPARLMQREIAYSRLPSITYAGAAESARTSQTLAQAMDRITSFAAKASAVEAEIKGAEYGAQKAPTKQQLEDAVEQGQDPDDILPGDTFTIFGQAARKQALSTLANTLEIDARESIAALQVEAEMMEMPIEQLAFKMNELLDGYSSTLDGVSPSLSRKFRASMGIVGNSIVTSHAKALNTNQKARDKVAALSAIDKTINQVEDIVSEPIIIPSDPGGMIITADDVLAAERNLIIQYGYNVGDKSLVDSKLKEFDEKVVQAKIGRVVDFVQQDPLANRRAVSEGKKPPNVSQEDFDSIMQTYASLDDEQRRQYRAQARDAFNQMLDDESKIAASNARSVDKRVGELKLEIFDARVNNDEPKVKELLQELGSINPEIAAQVEEEVYTSGGIDDAATVEHLTFKHLDGTLRSTDLLDARRAGTLSITTFRTLSSNLITLRGTSFTNAMKYAKDVAGYPPPTAVFFNKKQIRARKRVATIEAALIDEVSRNPDVNHHEFVKKQLIETDKDNTGGEADRSAAESTLLGMRRDLGLDDNATANDVVLELIEQNKANQFQDLIDALEGN